MTGTENQIVLLGDPRLAVHALSPSPAWLWNADARRNYETVLAAGVLIVEHLCNLDQLPDSGFSFTAAPPKFRGVGTFPVRAFARVP